VWRDSKTLRFLKMESMAQKLFNVEKLHMRHFLYCSYGDNGAYAIIQHRITFELLFQLSKSSVLESAHIRPASFHF